MRTVKGTPIFKADKYENIRDLILTSCEKNATLDAFIFRRNPKLSEVHRTYYEFGEDIKSLCAYISKSPYQGDKLAVVGENCYEWFVSYISMLPEEELITLLQRSESKVLFYHPKHHSMMVSIASKLKEGSIDIALEKFVCMYPDGLSSKETFPDDDDRFERFDDLIAAGKKIREEEGDKCLEIPIHNEEARIILFTSGTTSMSKGVLLSHKNICTNVHSITQTLYVVAGDRAFSILPLHHTFENTVDMFMLSVGVCLCLADGLRYIVPNLKEWHPEVCISVPLLFENIYQKIESGIEESGKKKLIDVMIPVTKFLKKFGIDLRRAVFKEILDKLGGDIRLVVIGGAGIDKRYIDAYTNFGIDFFMGYGLTETSPVISVTTTECNVHGSVGRPMVGIEAAIDTEDTSKNAVGEIITRSDCVMLGYYKNEEATKEVLTPDGWFHTGDMGYIDKTGSIHVTGRVKSMIVLTNGKKAFPEEIEILLNKIPGVMDSFVFGEPIDGDWTDLRIAVQIQYSAKEIAELYKVETPDEIRDVIWEKIKDVNQTIPHYKRVTDLYLTEEPFIKTTSLKIKRKEQIKKVLDI